MERGTVVQCHTTQMEGNTMSLKIKVVETKVSAKGDYRAIVRVLRYEDAMEALKSLCKPEELIEFEKGEAEKAKTLAEFTIAGFQTRKRQWGKGWIAEDIERHARREVLNLCREIIKNLEQETKPNPQPSHG